VIYYIILTSLSNCSTKAFPSLRHCSSDIRVSLPSAMSRAHLTIEIYADREPLCREDKLVSNIRWCASHRGEINFSRCSDFRWQAHARIRWRKRSSVGEPPMISLSLPTLLKLFPFAYSRNQMMFLLLLLKSRTEIDHSFRIDVIF